MAFSLALRRATSTTVPLAASAIKSTGTLQIYHSSLLGTLPLRNILSPQGPTSRASLSHVSSLSAKHQSFGPDADLLKVLGSEIKFASEEYRKLEKFPKGFPFKIEDEKGTNVIILRRSYKNEEIEVVVSMPSLVPGEEPDNDEEFDEDDNDHEDGQEGTAQFSIPLTVNISKGGATSLELGCTAYPDAIEIDAVLLRHGTESEGEVLAYQGPQYNHLDKNLQKALHKYLELRGVSPFTTNLLYEYMINKDNSEYLFWLKNLKRFLED